MSAQRVPEIPLQDACRRISDLEARFDQTSPISTRLKIESLPPEILALEKQLQGVDELYDK
jgi:hypothetical protein